MSSDKKDRKITVTVLPKAPLITPTVTTPKSQKKTKSAAGLPSVCGGVLKPKGFSAVKLRATGDNTPLLEGPVTGWAAEPRDGDPLYAETFNDGGFDEIDGVYTVPVTGRYLLTASMTVATEYLPTTTESPENKLVLTVDNRNVAAVVIPQVHPTASGFENPIIDPATLVLNRLARLTVGDNVVLAARITTGADAPITDYVSDDNYPMTFSATFLGA